MPVARRNSSTASFAPPKSNRIVVIVITGIGTILVAAGTIIAKWLMLKSIHEEMIEKFNTNGSMFFVRPGFCRVIEVVDEFNIITFPAACLLLLILCVTTRRVSFYRGRGCRGFIGPPIPIDFFSHVKRTFAAVIFAICADELLEIVSVIISGGDGTASSGT